MQIIEIKENQKEVWNKFIAENNSESFLQSWEWGSFQQATGKKIFRIGIEDSDKIIAIALLVKHNLPFGKNYLYCPRGPVVNELKVFNFLFNEIKKIAKEERSLFLRIDPPMEQRLKNSSFKKSLNEIQPRNTLILDLTKSEEELLKEMKQKTRYNIRLAGKKELRIMNQELRMDNKKVFKEKFEEFWKLTKETSRRDKFSSHNKNYYWKMLESLSECDINESEQTLVCLQSRLYLAEYKNKIIAANIVLFFGNIAVYLHGASSSEYRNIMAPYLLQWRQIIDAKKAGCKKYDFWGIASKSKIQNPKSNSWGGITKFKKGFGGEEKNYIGAYNLVFDSIGYTIYKSVKFIKLKIYKVKNLFCKN